MSGSVAYSLLLPNVTGQQPQPQNFSTAYNPMHAAMGPHDSETMLYKLEKRIQKGNRSREAQSWVGGTTPHDIRLQRIPGYQGFQPGLKAENVHGKTFAKVSANAVQKKIFMGKNSVSKMQDEERLATISQSALGEMRTQAEEKYQT